LEEELVIYGLSVNANETIEEIVKKSVIMEKLGFQFVWVADLPSQRYSPAIASVIAEKTKRIRIGLGLLSPFLHSPSQIAHSLITLTTFYGDRFELCIGPGDKDQLKRVGIESSKLDNIPKLLLKAKEEIVKELRRNMLKVRIWLGAQGPKILRLARFFDGVLLNYAHPRFVSWAIKKISLPSKYSVQVGIYAPSYIYLKKEEEPYQLLRLSSLIVATGTSNSVLKKFNLYDKVAKAKEELEKGLTPEEILSHYPSDFVEDFAIYLHCTELDGYLSKLEEIGVKHVVFGYPQNFSLKTIQDLAHSLFKL
jgi:hypothetical protein